MPVLGRFLFSPACLPFPKGAIVVQTLTFCHHSQCSCHTCDSLAFEETAWPESRLVRYHHLLNHLCDFMARNVTFIIIAVHGPVQKSGYGKICVVLERIVVAMLWDFQLVMEPFGKQAIKCMLL